MTVNQRRIINIHQQMVETFCIMFQRWFKYFITDLLMTQLYNLDIMLLNSRKYIFYLDYSQLYKKATIQGFDCVNCCGWVQYALYCSDLTHSYHLIPINLGHKLLTVGCWYSHDIAWSYLTCSYPEYSLCSPPTGFLETVSSLFVSCYTSRNTNHILK